MNSCGRPVDRQPENLVVVRPHFVRSLEFSGLFSQLSQSFPSFARSFLQFFNVGFHSQNLQNNRGGLVSYSPFHTAYYYYYCFIYKERNA